MVEQPGRPSCVGKYTKAVWELHLRIRFLFGTLLLAGPAVSLPSILVLHSIMGARKTAVFILLVVVMATITGMIFGTFYG